MYVPNFPPNVDTTCLNTPPLKLTRDFVHFKKLLIKKYSLNNSTIMKKIWTLPEYNAKYPENNEIWDISHLSQKYLLDWFSMISYINQDRLLFILLKLLHITILSIYIELRPKSHLDSTFVLINHGTSVRIYIRLHLNHINFVNQIELIGHHQYYHHQLY